MSEYAFGLGQGHLGDDAREIAERHDATLVNYTDPGCSCGYGCRREPCPNNRRHWFVVSPDYGFPFSHATAKAVMQDLMAAGIVSPPVPLERPEDRRYREEDERLQRRSDSVGTVRKRGGRR